MEDQNFQQELKGVFDSVDEKLKNELATFEKKCMSYNDVDKFVSCMEQVVEKVEKEQKNFEYRIAFLENKTSECLKRAEEGKTDKEKCKQQTRNALVNYTDIFLFNIRK
ncbi:hypothetical protein ABPG72_008398 [Tetrahymena utriculariae]